MNALAEGDRVLVAGEGLGTVVYVFGRSASKFRYGVKLDNPLQEDGGEDCPLDCSADELEGPL